MEQIEQYWSRHEQQQYMMRIEDEHKRQNHRISMLEENYKQLTELTICVKEQTMIMDAMSKEIKRQGEQIGKIINEPVRQWQRVKDKAVDTAIGAVVGALVVAIITLIAQYI